MLLQCLRWMVTFGDGPELYRRDSNPSSNRGWPIIRNVTHIHGLARLCKNTYISSLGHDDASSDSFDGANACAVLPRPVSGAFHAERVLGPLFVCPVLTVWVRAVGKVRVPSRPTSRVKKVGLQGLPWTRKHITFAVAVAQGGLAT